jgi:hypothetical protein
LEERLTEQNAACSVAHLIANDEADKVLQLLERPDGHVLDSLFVLFALALELADEEVRAFRSDHDCSALQAGQGKKKQFHGQVRSLTSRIAKKKIFIVMGWKFHLSEALETPQQDPGSSAEVDDNVHGTLARLQRTLDDESFVKIFAPSYDAESTREKK